MSRDIQTIRDKKQLAAFIHQEYRESRRKAVEAMEHALNIGGALVQSKTVVQAGTWLYWFQEQQFPFGERQAQKYVKLYENRDEVRKLINQDANSSSDLTFLTFSINETLKQIEGGKTRPLAAPVPPATTAIPVNAPASRLEFTPPVPSVPSVPPMSSMAPPPPLAHMPLPAPPAPPRGMVSSAPPLAPPPLMPPWPAPTPANDDDFAGPDQDQDTAGDEDDFDQDTLADWREATDHALDLLDPGEYLPRMAAYMVELAEHLGIEL